MLRRLQEWDSRRWLAAGLVAGSVALIAAGVIAIVLALGSDGVDLPSEGAISEIAGDDAQEQPAEVAGADAAPLGPPPVRMVIPKLHIDAPVITEGVDESNNPVVPERPDQVAWYNFSATPGSMSNAVFSGHVDWQTEDRIPIPGVFYRLKEMKVGDSIKVTLEGGSELEYRVTGNVATAYDDPNIVRVMSSTSRDVITVITCGGTWVRDRSPHGGSYSHRVIVRAERVTGVAAADAAANDG